jgi:putative endonuclease
LRRKETGQRGERLAQKLLADKGYEIVTTNYRCTAGEIDIIARDGDCLVFVEVRTKTGTDFGYPEESITLTKQRHLVAVAAHYCLHHRFLPANRRIDVVAITIDQAEKPVRIEHIENAIADTRFNR